MRMTTYFLPASAPRALDLRTVFVVYSRAPSPQYPHKIHVLLSSKYRVISIIKIFPLTNFAGSVY